MDAELSGFSVPLEHSFEVGEFSWSSGPDGSEIETDIKSAKPLFP